MTYAQTQIEQKIEEAIQSGNLFRLSRLINTYLTQKKWSKEARIFSAISYRRLEAYKKGLKVLNAKFTPALWSRCSDVELRLQAQAIQLFVFLGATRIALELVNRMPKSRSSLILPQLAGIYLHCGEFKHALECNQKIFEREADKNSHFSTYALAKAGLCQGLLGNWRSAKSVLDSVMGRFPEDHCFEYSIHSYLLMSLVRGERAEEAEQVCKKMLGFLDQNDPAIWKANVYEGYGASLAMMGRYDEAHKMLDRALDVFHRPERMPSDWFESVYWKGFIEFKQTRRLPPQWARILVYPQMSRCKEYQEMIKKKITPPHSILMDLEGPTERVSSSLHYNLPSQTKIEGYGGPSCHHKLGFHLLDRALIILVLVGSNGIPEYAFFDELWKDDLSVLQCQRRISQVVKRLRQEGYPLEWEAGKIRLTKKPDVTCQWSSEMKPKGWIFLEEHPQFSRKDLQDFFLISKNQAIRICSDWLAEGVVARNPKNISIYEVQKKSQ